MNSGKTGEDVAFEVGVLLRWLLLHRREGKGTVWWNDARDHLVRLAQLLGVEHPCLEVLEKMEAES